MATGLLTALVLLIGASLCLFLTAHERTLSSDEPVEDPAAPPAPEPPSTDVAPTTAAPACFRITSHRARCYCGHALERHDRCTRDLCGCPQFVYAGGLVDPPPAPRTEAVAVAEAPQTRVA